MIRPGASRGRRPGIALLGAAGLALAACGSSEGHGPQVLYPTATVVPWALRVAGLGDRVVVSSRAAPAGSELHLLRQDALDPDQLRDLATVPGPATARADAMPIPSVDEEWTTVPWGGGGTVERVGTDGPYGAAAAFPVPGPVLRAAAIGRWLVAVSAGEIRLYDATTPPTATLLATFPLAVPVTEIAAAGAGVFVFTTTGYGYLDPGAATWVAFDSPRMKGVTRAQAYAGKLYVAGPSQLAGRFRIARLDASAAPGLAVEVEDDRIPEPEFATLSDFAFDPRTGEYLLLSISPAAGSSTLPPSLLRYRESGRSLVLAGTVALAVPPLPDGGLALPPAGPYVLHASGGRAYLVTGGAPGGVAAYRLP